MFGINRLKGSRCASLFFFILVYLFVNTAFAQSQQSAINTAHTLELDKNSTWMSLLHVSNNKPHITSSPFLLTATSFSLEAELDATIAAFYSQEPQQYLCQFPARYFWLKHYINLPELHYELCDDLRMFEQKAPVDQISAVYVSENIAQPSSMMGHLFLKISGLNKQAKPVEHAISFYTETKTLNIPKLMYDSMIKGKKGFFALSPYSEKVNTYVHNEQRNLWELELQLSDDQRRLIQLHLYELKQAELTYFFQNYNCATVISFILSLAIPELQEPNDLWTTPLDIAKKINASKRVRSTIVQSSNRWNLRMLQTQLPKKMTQTIKKSIEVTEQSLPPTESEQQHILSIKMVQSYNDYRYEKNIIDINTWNSTTAKINQYDASDIQPIINLSDYKNPLHTIQDSQVWLGVASQNKNFYLRTGIVPASHSIEDDNRQYFGETGLHLANISVLTDVSSGNTYLEKFELYSVESIIPYDTFTGGMSGKFSIGIEPVFTQQLKTKQEAFIKGALGYTYAISPDIDVYGLAGVGIAHASNANYIYVSPEIGFVVREIFDMKSIVAFTQNYGQLHESESLNELNFTQATYLTQNYAIFFHAKKITTQGASLNSYDITLKRYF